MARGVTNPLSFYRYFRRAAIVPRRLSHPAALYQIRDPPGEITVLDLFMTLPNSSLNAIVPRSDFNTIHGRVFLFATMYCIYQCHVGPISSVTA